MMYVGTYGDETVRMALLGASLAKPAPNPRGRGRPHRRIIRTIKRGDREYQLHATKGWRSYRAGTA